MKTLTSLLLGFMGGFLIYMEAAMVFLPMDQTQPDPTFVFATFIGGWLISTYIIQKNTQNVAQVMKRGSLYGAVLWIMMAGAGLLLSGKAVVQTAGDNPSDATAAGAAIGGGLSAVIAGGLSFSMVIVCMICYLVFALADKEKKDENLVSCPQCAESIKPEAKVCRYCKAQVSA